MFMTNIATMASLSWSRTEPIRSEKYGAYDRAITNFGCASTWRDEVTVSLFVIQAHRQILWGVWTSTVPGSRGEEIIVTRVGRGLCGQRLDFVWMQFNDVGCTSPTFKAIDSFVARIHDDDFKVEIQCEFHQVEEKIKVMYYAHYRDQLAVIMSHSHFEHFGTYPGHDSFVCSEILREASNTIALPAGRVQALTTRAPPHTRHNRLLTSAVWGN